MSLRRLLFPDPRRHLPGSRWLNITARTVHLTATGILLGAHYFDIPASSVSPFLWAAILSGAAMIAIEMYPTAHWAHQLCALFVYAKLALLCLVPFVWDQRLPILLAVVALAGVGSHAPRRFRHYSVVLRKVMVD